MRIDACAEGVRREHGSAALPEGGSRAATAQLASFVLRVRSRGLALALVGAPLTTCGVQIGMH